MMKSTAYFFFVFLMKFLFFFRPYGSHLDYSFTVCTLCHLVCSAYSPFDFFFSFQQRIGGGPQGMTMDWKPPGSPSSFLVKRVLRLDIPVDRYPNVSLSWYHFNRAWIEILDFNFVFKLSISLKTWQCFWAAVQFCGKTFRSSRQFPETRWSFYGLSCLYQGERFNKGCWQGKAPAYVAKLISLIYYHRWL